MVVSVRLSFTQSIGVIDVKNRVLLCLLLLFSLGAWGQRVDSRITTTTNPPPLGGYTPILAVPGSQITLCSYPANGTPCTNLATSYTDASLTTTCPAGKPVVLQGSSTCGSYTDQLGNFGFWVAPGCYTYTSQLNGSTKPPKAICSGAGSTGVAGLATYSKQGLVAGGIGYVSPGIITTDAFAAINAVGATLPASGGIIDATALGSNTYTVTTQLTALNNASQAIVLILNPQTKFIINTFFTSPSSSGPETCAVQVGPSDAGQPNGASGIITTGMNYLGGYQFQLGPNARISDLICSGAFDGSQESMFLDGVGVEGNPAGVLTNALIHLQGIFGPTKIINSGTTRCLANCLLVQSGSGGASTGAGNILFQNDVFEDGYTGSAVYGGCVVNLDTVSSSGGLGNLLFSGGIIQANGPHNPLLCMNGHGGSQLSVIKFENTYFETLAATTSSFFSNIDPIQLIDANQIYFDAIKSGGAETAPDYIYIGTTHGNYSSFATQIDSLVTGNTYTNLINNTTEGTVETGYLMSNGDRIIPPYTSNLNAPFNRRTNSAPPGGLCTTATQGSGWYNSNGTTVATTAYICSAISGTPTWTPFGSGGGGAVASVANSDGTLTVSPTTGSVVASLNLTHANTWIATQTFTTFAATTITSKFINGEGICVNYPQGTVTGQIQACLSDALNRANGNTTGVADASGMNGNLTLTSEIDVGSAAGTSVFLKIPCNGTWQSSVTDGTSVTVKLFGGSEILGCPVSAAGGAFFFGANGSSNVYAILEIVGSTTPYVYAQGFNALNSAGHATASHYTVIVDGSPSGSGFSPFSDGSLVENVNVNDFSNPSGGGALFRNVCCGFTWADSAFNSNGGSGGTPVTVQADATSYIQGLNFLNDTMVDPGTGKNAFLCTDTRSTKLSYVNIIGGPYNETGGSDTTTPIYQVTGCAQVAFTNITGISNVANSTAPLIAVSNAYNSFVTVRGVVMKSGTGTWTYPATVVNNANDARSPVQTDALGNFDSYTTNTVPSSLGIVNLSNGSTAPTQAASDNSTKIATTGFGALQFASPPALGSTTPNQVNATKVLVQNGTLTGFAGSGSATFAAGAGMGTSAATPICLASFSCNSIAGTVSLTTAASGLTTGALLTINLPGTRTNPGGSIYPPNCSVSIVPTTGTAANYGIGVIPTNTTGTVALPVTVLTALAASTTYILHYGPCEGI